MTTAQPGTGIRRIRVGANGHRYEINRQKTISVTTVLGMAVAKPGLMGWAGRCAAEEAVDLLRDVNPDVWMAQNGITNDRQLIQYLAKASERRRNTAAVRGTKIHSYADKMVRGEPVDVPEELVPYVDNCARFMDEWRVAPLLHENVVGSYQWGYGGTFDLVGALPDGRRILWDYKTGKKIYPEVKLQLAAYRYADSYLASSGVEIPMSEVGITDSKVVWIRDNGYDVIPVESGPAEFKTFLHCLQVAKTMQAMEGWEGIPERRPK